VGAAREAAYDIVARVRAEDAYANLLLPSVLRQRDMSARDAALVTELVSGTIRRQGTYDAVLGACTDRPLADVDPAVLDALRLGTHQLLSMRVPTHAAVSTTVELVRSRVGHGPVGFTNAVLRRVAAHPLADWVRLVAPPDEAGFLSVAHSHPRWVVARLGDALAASAGSRAELPALLEADNAAPRVTLVARPGLAAVEELPGRPTGLSPYAVVLDHGYPGAIPAVVEGRAGVQDEGSQMVALALAEVTVTGVDDRWLDVCAGPGGKAALLAAVAATRGARVLAAELQPHRADLVRSGTTATRAGLLGVVAADGTRPGWRPRTFDRVLLDAPCTGLGALRRRPEARWRRTESELDVLVPLQRELLRHAVESVRVGGVVAYVTCSPVLEETAGVVTAALGAGGVVLEDARPFFPTAGHDGPMQGTVQLWPHRHGTDAMFLALLRRMS
jgi:16S rRNA (cytosine967-C5)-methyltransferase